jgi:hypothetical protein
MLFVFCCCASTTATTTLWTLCGPRVAAVMHSLFLISQYITCCTSFNRCNAGAVRLQGLSQRLPS